MPALSGEIKILLGATLFAFIPVGGNMAPTTDPSSLLFGRLIIACLILYFIQLQKGQSRFKLENSQIPLLFIWASLILGAMLCYFYAIRTSGMAISWVLLGTNPIMIILLAGIILKERITLTSILAGTLTVAGILLIVDWNHLNLQTSALGQLAAIASAILLGGVFILQKKYLLDLKTTEAVFYQSLFQIPVLIPFIVIQPPSFSIDYWSASILLGAVCTVGSYLLIYSGAKQVATQKIGILQSIEYVIPIFIGVLFYQDSLSIWMIIGVITILASCLLVQLKTS